MNNQDIGKMICLRDNNTASNRDACAICGGYCEAEWGVELFRVETWSPVCRKCGEQYAPYLLAARDLWQDNFNTAVDGTLSAHGGVFDLCLKT